MKNGASDLTALQEKLHKKLQKAIRVGNLDNVNQLLQSEALCACIAFKHNSALRSAVNYGHRHIVDRLLMFKDVQDNVGSLARWYEFSQLIKGNHIEIFNRLLEFSFVKFAVLKMAHPLLQLATEYGKVSFVEKLLEFNEIKDSSEFRKNTYLNLAASKGHLAVVNCLLGFEVGYDNFVNVRQAIYSADRNGHFEVVQRLSHLGGRPCLEVLKLDDPSIHAKILNERLAIARKALILKKSRSKEGLGLPLDIRCKIISFAFHDLACGKRHQPVMQKDGAGEVHCLEVINFVANCFRKY